MWRLDRLRRSFTFIELIKSGGQNISFTALTARPEDINTCIQISDLMSQEAFVLYLSVNILANLTSPLIQSVPAYGLDY
jgi:hypothetical protein